jgi:hypothetical protein
MWYWYWTQHQEPTTGYLQENQQQKPGGDAPQQRQQAMRKKRDAGTFAFDNLSGL